MYRSEEFCLRHLFYENKYAENCIPIALWKSSNDRICSMDPFVMLKTIQLLSKTWNLFGFQDY